VVAVSFEMVTEISSGNAVDLQIEADRASFVHDVIDNPAASLDVVRRRLYIDECAYRVLDRRPPRFKMLKDRCRIH